MYRAAIKFAINSKEHFKAEKKKLVSSNWKLSRAGVGKSIKILEV